MFKYLDPYTLRARLSPAIIAAAPAFAAVALLISWTQFSLSNTIATAGLVLGKPAGPLSGSTPIGPRDIVVTPDQAPVARVVAIPDADWSPEMLAGLAPLHGESVILTIGTNIPKHFNRSGRRRQGAVLAGVSRKFVKDHVKR